MQEIKTRINVKSGWKASVSRLLTLTKKTLLRFYRNPKAMGFLIGIPVIYYLILGLIFGGSDMSQMSSYSIGWVDSDSTSANHDLHTNYDLNFVYDVFKEIENITVEKYDSKDDAKEAALADKINSYVYFPDGFEAYLERNSYTNIAFWNNNTTTSQNYSISLMYDQLVSLTPTFFKFTNVTSSANQVLINFASSYDYDGILILNNNFGKGLDNKWNVNMSYLFRNGLDSGKLYYTTGVITTIANGYFRAVNSTSNVTIPITYSVPDSSLMEPVEYQIFFLQSVSPTVKSIIENLVSSVISDVINYNPTKVDLSYEVESAQGQVVNNLTYSSPGYILYGAMSVLSFALIVLTSEKKDGIFKRLSSSEAKNWEIIMSNVIANVVLVFMQIAIGMIILIAFGWNPIIFSLTDAIIGCILNIFLFSFLILALAFALAPVFKDPDTAGGGVWIVLIPLMMFSGIFFPLEFLPESVQAIANWLPTRFAVIIFQNLLLKGLPLSNPSTLMNMGFLALYSAVIFVIGLLAFKKFKQ